MQTHPLFSRAPLQVEDIGDFEIGVCDEGLNVFARIVMRGADRVRRMEDDLAGLGYQPLCSGSSAQLRGCDLLIGRAASAKRPAERS